MKKTLIICLSALILLLSLVGVVACNEEQEEEYIDYGKNNSYSVNVIDDDDAVSFEPNTSADKKYGLIFYVAAYVSPARYEYLGKSLAAQGYVVVIPKSSGNIPLQSYKKDDVAFSKYPDTKFFVAGHSNEGAGACVRRCNDSNVLGAILITPILATTPVVDSDSNPVLDNVNQQLNKVNETLLNFSKPILLVEGAKDSIRTQQQIEDAKSALAQGYQYKRIENANHISFCEMGVDDELTVLEALYANDLVQNTYEQQQEQRTLLSYYILDFMKNTLNG